MWGAKAQGYECVDCGFVCHSKCQELCKPTCGTVLFYLFILFYYFIYLKKKIKKGAIRIKFKYTEEYLLPLPSYSKLLEVFFYFFSFFFLLNYLF